MIDLIILALFALTGAGCAWVAKEDDSPTEKMNTSEQEFVQPKSGLSVEKHREYDAGRRTLTETMTTTKVFPDVDPEDLEEVY
ncbi:MAG: hypothetical protein NWE95_01820 [Candidatus Bathyarchaeota archaeon]|nr:hypothetical protein [Candidatus Bathyarchaeota archaeon]